MISGIFESIERLIEYIPIDTDSPTNGHFGTGTTIDSRYYFEDIDGIAIRLGVLEVGNNTISFRDIIKLFNKFLTNATIDEIVATKRYRQIQKISCSGLPVSQLLFDFCLAPLDGDILNAKLYLAHSFYILGLHREINLLLSVIINEPYLIEDEDVRKLLALLARVARTSNSSIHLGIYSSVFGRRYAIYTQELNRLTLLCENKIG